MKTSSNTEYVKRTQKDYSISFKLQVVGEIESGQLDRLEIEKPDVVWIGDITYVGNRTNPSYLTLITDAYSKKIVI